MLVVYFSGASEYTHKFVTKLNTAAERIPLKRQDPELLVDQPYVLIIPTYGFGGARAVPPQVIRFLNNEENRKNLKAVIGTGNTNFNKDYCKAANIVATKCQVPVLYRLELLGTPDDVENVKELLGENNYDSTQ